MTKEMVHHPDHYQGKGGLEVWQVQEAFTADLKGVIAGDACAIIKYACRWPKKNGVEDLKKIIEYANHLIEKLEEEEPATEVGEDIIIHQLAAILDDMLFPTQAEASNVVYYAKNTLTTQGHVSILEVLEIARIDTEYIRGMGSHGWTNFDTIGVYPDSKRAAWVIQFPPIKNLEKEKESN